MKRISRMGQRTRKSIRAIRVICGLLLLSSEVRAGGVKIELPAETAALKKAPGSELVTAQCIVCHSVEYISTQPPLPRTYWLGAVTKMQQKFGAPVAPTDVEAIVDYLAKNYGAEPAPNK
ncbi:MAG: cytochrome c [Chthoniobacteraceae bacterium]